MKKGFLYVSEKELTYKNAKKGIQGKEHKYMVPKLSKKSKQFCCLGDIKSKVDEIEERVPQGRHLVSTLYFIYTESLYKIPLNGKLFSYADDSTML